MDMPDMVRRLLAVCLAAAAALSTPVVLSAQEAPDRVIDEVVVTDTPAARDAAEPLKLPLTDMETPASTGVVTSDVITAQGAGVLGDALRNTAGVNVQSGSGVHDLFYIRGFESLTSGLVLTDGAIEPEVSFYNLYNVERVETLKGPAAFLYGGSPLSGAVNLVRKTPLFGEHANFGVAYGAFQTSRGTVDVGWSDGEQVALRLNGLWRDSENYRDDKENSTLAVNPALRWRADENVTLDLSFEYAELDYKPDAGQPLVNGELPSDVLPSAVLRSTSYQSPFDRSDQTTMRARFDLTAELSDSVTLRNKTYLTQLDWLTDGTLFGEIAANDTGSWEASRFLTSLDDEQRATGNQLEVAARFDTGALSHTVLTGVEVTQTTDAFTLSVSLLPDIDVFSPQETAATPLYVIEQQGQAVDATTLVAAPYLVDRVALSDKVQVFLGGRHDWVDYEDDISGQRRDYAQFSPMLGAVYAHSDDLSVYGNFGRAFAPPSTRVVGEVDAEESEQFELGVKHIGMDGKARGALAVYFLERDITIPDSSQITEQLGVQRSRGIEAQIEVRPDDTSSVAVAYAFNDSEYTEFMQNYVFLTEQGPLEVPVDRAGATPAFAPEHILNIWAEKRLDNGLALTLGARYVGEQYISEDNEYVIDSVLTLDAGLAYVYDDITWRLNVRNLTDREYSMRGFGAASVIPADPVAVYSSLNWSL
jgi:TonB-dependent siderophore receptor